MPPVSRRQKQYDEQLRRVQNRNIAAGVLLFVAVAVGIWVLLKLRPPAPASVFVSINHVNYGNEIRTIPFAAPTCELLQYAFLRSVISAIPSQHEIASDESRDAAVASLTENDVLIFYLNGHLISENNEVYLKTPESEDQGIGKVTQKPLSYWLEPLEAVNNQPKLTLLLLDAGQYSWSPLFPGRQANEFQRVLEAKVKSDDWKKRFGDNFYVMVSHSSEEVSLTSTPLRSSLFGYAVADALHSEQGNMRQLISVGQFYNDVHDRVISFSRNFKNQSLQHPILMQAGVGVITDPGSIAQGLFSTKEAELPPEDSTTVTVAEIRTVKGPAKNEFLLSSEFQAPRQQDVIHWYKTDRQYERQNYEMIRQLENYLGLGADVTPGENVSDADSREELIDTSKFKFDQEKLSAKQSTVDSYRKSTLELCVLTRFLNQIYFWDDMTKEDVERLGDVPLESNLSRLSDSDLRESDSYTELQQWVDQWNAFKSKRKLGDLFAKVRDEVIKEKLVLTPFQAELLGVLSQRYLPLLNPDLPATADAKANEENNNQKTSANPKFELNLNWDLKSETADSSTNLWAQVRNYEGPFLRLLENANDSDTLHRLALAVFGSESIKSRAGVKPNIKWAPIVPKIAANPDRDIKINRFNSHFPIELEMEAVSKVEIKFDESELPPEVKVYLDVNEKTSFYDENRELTLVGQSRFMVNFYVSEIDAQQEGKKYQFQIIVSDAHGRAAPVTLKINAELTNQDALQVSSARKLIAAGGDRSTRMIPWQDTPEQFGDDWQPLLVSTFPNIKSGFQFELQNNSSSDKSFEVRLYSIQSLSSEIRNRMLADRISVGAGTDYMNWLTKRSVQPGSRIFDDPEYLQRIGQAQIELGTNSPKKEISLLPYLPPQEETEGAAEAVPVNQTTSEIKFGLLLVLWEREARLADTEGGPAGLRSEPSWYQFIQFEPADPINVETITQIPVQLLPGIEDMLGTTKLAELKQAVLPDYKKEAARMTVVSPLTPFGESSRLTLDELFNGSRLGVDQREAAIVMIDVFGVPNFATFKSRESMITTTPFREYAVGVRAASIPPGAVCYPSNWSFVPSNGWDQSLETKQIERNIFYRSAASNGLGDAGSDDAEVVLEFSMPLGQTSPLKDQQDFWIRWKGGETDLDFPVRRQNHLEFQENQIVGWTVVHPHSLSPKAFSLRNATLEIGRRGEKAIGRWQFITESSGRQPVLSLVNNRIVYSTSAELTSALNASAVDLDLSKIQPPLNFSLATLKIGEKEKELSKINGFLQRHLTGEQQYSFSLSELEEQLDLELKTGSYRLSIGGVDFFGESVGDSQNFSIEFRKPPKVVVDPGKPNPAAKPPQPVDLAVAFSAAEGKEIQDIREFSSITINGQGYPFNQKIVVGKSDDVFIQRKSGSLVVHNLLPGVYEISVSAAVKNKGENVAIQTAAAKVNVGPDSASTTLPFRD